MYKPLKLKRTTAARLMAQVAGPGLKPLLREPEIGATIYEAQRGCLEICCENDWYEKNGRIKLTITDGIGGNQIRMYFHPDTLHRDFVAEDAEKEDDRRASRVQWVGSVGREQAHKLVDQYWEA